MGRNSDYMNRAEFEEQLEGWSEALLRSLLKILAPAGLNDPALIAARQRAAEMQETDPTFAGQVAAVRKARETGAHITEGVDPGFRRGPGVQKISGPVEGDAEDVRPGSALEAIKHRATRRNRR